jgi:hypothetical protein
MRQSSWVSVGVLLGASSVLGACGDEGQENLDLVAPPVVNGTPLDEAAVTSGVVQIFGCTGGSFRGSGFLLTNDWIVTAHHVVACATAPGELPNVQVQMGGLRKVVGSGGSGGVSFEEIPGGQDRQVSQIITYPLESAKERWVDVALVRVSDPFEMPDTDGDGSLTTGFRRRLYDGDLESLYGRECKVMGYGPVKAFCPSVCLPTMDGSEAAVLREAPQTITAMASDFLKPHPLAKTYFGTMPRFVGNNTFQHGWRGDSGSPCFLDGEVVAGLFASVMTTDGRGAYLSASTFRDWVQQVIFESATRDFTGDGGADVVMREFENGLNPGLTMGTAKPQVFPEVFSTGSFELPQVTDTGFTIVGSGDFNNDSFADVAWQHVETRQPSIWLLGPLSDEGQVTILPDGIRGIPTLLTDLNWEIVAVADVNGDRSSDFLWQHSESGLVCYWLMNSITTTSSVFQSGCVEGADPAWRLVGAADFDRHEIKNSVLTHRLEADLFWRNPTTGETRLWLMTFSTDTYTMRREIVLPTEPIDRTVAALADYDQDGQVDVLWRTVDGTLGVWLWNQDKADPDGFLEVEATCGNAPCVDNAIPSGFQVVAP